MDIPDSGLDLEEVEKRLLTLAMERSGGVIAKAARLLGLTYRTMQYRLDKHGIHHQTKS
jgi:transcriptional regulator with GAF, ATPase, and Fis domain